mgnify:CR=1 FL=1
MKRLSENPQDPQALKQLYEAQKEMSNWAESKNKPGQFTGHTGAKILTHAELSMGVQAWARQEQFTKAQKVQGKKYIFGMLFKCPIFPFCPILNFIDFVQLFDFSHFVHFLILSNFPVLSNMSEKMDKIENVEKWTKLKKAKKADEFDK